MNPKFRGEFFLVVKFLDPPESGNKGWFRSWILESTHSNYTRHLSGIRSSLSDNFTVRAVIRRRTVHSVPSGREYTGHKPALRAGLSNYDPLGRRTGPTNSATNSSGHGSGSPLWLISRLDSSAEIMIQLRRTLGSQERFRTLPSISCWANLNCPLRGKRYWLLAGSIRLSFHFTGNFLLRYAMADRLNFVEELPPSSSSPSSGHFGEQEGTSADRSATRKNSQFTQ